MPDLFLDGTGDIKRSASGDLAITDTPWRNDIQQAYVRAMTDPGDFLIYPDLGAGLSYLYGMPQSAATGEYGVQLIRASLERESRFAGSTLDIRAIPIGVQSIRFDINIRSASGELVTLSVEQEL